MKKVLLLFIVLCGCQLSAQAILEKPDYAQIEKSISDAASEMYYPKLMDRFRKGDTTMTLPQRRHLYYGFRFQKSYNPSGIPKEAQTLRTLLQNKPMSDADALEVITIGKKILTENPFDLRMMNVLLYASEQVKDMALFNTTLGQMKITVDALSSSGDGKSKQTAFYVINVSDEYQLLAVLGFQPAGKQSLVDAKYDYLEIKENPEGIKGLYFEVSPSLDFLGKKLGE